MSSWGAATKGKGKGKGKGKAASGFPEGAGKGHTLPRTRLSAEKFSGTVAAWKGKYGWLTPSEEIEHEKASLHNGSLFASKDDIVGGDALEVGAPVQFHIWEDESGLGAEEIVQTGPAAGGAAAAAAAGKGKAAGKAAAGSKGGTVYATSKTAVKGAAGKTPSWGAGAGAASSAGSKGWSAPATAKGKGWGAPAKTVITSTFNKPAAKGLDKGKAKGKGGKQLGGKGHTLPRTRISAEKFTGTVSAWKGKYGWITPAEEIGHEKATSHRGGIFVSKDDLQDIQELTTGATVEFHIWEDATGLGAEEVVQY